MTLKTRPNRASVHRFISGVKDTQKRKDARTLLAMMKEITGERPVMWGDSIVGFGSYHYRYRSGREGDWMLTGFSPRAQNLTVYLMSGCRRHRDLLGTLGKHKTASSCLYIQRLSDVDLRVLRNVIRQSVALMKKKRRTV